MSEKNVNIEADQIKGVIVGDVKKAETHFHNGLSIPGNGRNGEKTDKDPPKMVWIPALVITGVLILFMLIAFFITETLTSDQRNILHLVFCLLAGFSTTFLGGAVLMKLELPIGNRGKMFISATAGIAIFIFTYLRAPFWYVGG